MEIFGAGNETRTRDPNLGKVVLYQLSYSRTTRRAGILGAAEAKSSRSVQRLSSGQAARRYATMETSVARAASSVIITPVE